MADPSPVTFLGQPKEWWDLVNGLANWLVAIGTIGAVVVSLYLARSSDKLQLKISAGSRRIFRGYGEPGIDQFVISVTNRSRRIARISSFGYRVGKRRKNSKYAIQVHDTTDRVSSPLPVDLNDGQEAHWFIPLSARVGGHDWLEGFARDFLLPDWRTRINQVHIQIYTTVGGVFEAPIEQSMKDKLIEVCQRIEASPVA